MQVTTSRDPSAKARRLGKALASFLSVPYANRGKQSPGEDDTWLVVVEDHGNPRGLVKRSNGVEEQLCFKVALEPETARGRSKKIVPVVTGRAEEALPIARFFELEWQEPLAHAPKRALVVASGQIDFVDEDALRSGLTVDSGALRNRSGQRYRAVIVPSVSVISHGALAKLKALAAARGRVVWLGRPPAMLEAGSFRNAAPFREDLPWALSEPSGRLTPAVLAAEGTAAMFV